MDKLAQESSSLNTSFIAPIKGYYEKKVSKISTTIEERNMSLKRKASNCDNNLDLDLSLGITTRKIAVETSENKSASGEEEIDESSLSLSLSSNNASNKLISKLIKGDQADPLNQAGKEVKEKRASTLDLTI